MTESTHWATVAAQIKDSLDIGGAAVGVRFVNESGSDALDGFERAERHRYCQALMRARRGDRVYLDAGAIACPAAAAAFGFKPLPEGLASGRGLVGFGIVQKPKRGRDMFESMSRLSPDEIEAVTLSPLEELTEEPDVVVFEGPTEALMWVLLAYFNVTGERVTGSTAVLQATCVDATVIPYLTGRANYSLGCYGCRDATDLEPAETVVGMPGEVITEVASALEFLAERAMPRSREKGAYHALIERGDVAPCGTDRAT